jgi:hypothetical protein
MQTAYYTFTDDDKVFMRDLEITDDNFRDIPVTKLEFTPDEITYLQAMVIDIFCRATLNKITHKQPICEDLIGIREKVLFYVES